MRGNLGVQQTEIIFFTAPKTTLQMSFSKLSPLHYDYFRRQWKRQQQYVRAYNERGRKSIGSVNSGREEEVSSPHNEISFAKVIFNSQHRATNGVKSMQQNFFLVRCVYTLKSCRLVADDS